MGVFLSRRQALSFPSRYIVDFRSWLVQVWLKFLSRSLGCMDAIPIFSARLSSISLPNDTSGNQKSSLIEDDLSISKLKLSADTLSFDGKLDPISAECLDPSSSRSTAVVTNGLANNMIFTAMLSELPGFLSSLEWDIQSGVHFKTAIDHTGRRLHPAAVSRRGVWQPAVPDTRTRRIAMSITFTTRIQR